MGNFKIKFTTRVGGRSENQDYYKILKIRYGLVVVVCDGMGGTKGGKYAAETAANKILEEILASQGSNPKDVIKTAISNANTLISDERLKNQDLRGMGTTVAVLLVNDSNAMCFHVGDSRIYQFRKGTISYRTSDHSKVFDMVRMGILTEEEARVSSESNVINRALGIRPDVEIEVSDELPYRKGDRFLICTDGIWGAVPETQLIEKVSLKNPIEEVVLQLTEDIDQIGIENGGGHDNLTAVLIEMQNDSILEEKKVNKPHLKKWHMLVLASVALILIVLIVYYIFK